MKVYVVTAKNAPGSSEEEETRVVNVSKTEKGAKWAGLVDFVENWVQGDWSGYRREDVRALRRAMLDKDVDKAWTIQASMSGYKLDVQYAQPADGEPFNIEGDFDPLGHGFILEGEGTVCMNCVTGDEDTAACALEDFECVRCHENYEVEE